MTGEEYPYEYLPALPPAEIAQLKKRIVHYGVKVPIVVDENGAIIDGHHRYRIATALGIKCPRVVKEGLSEVEKRTMAMELNICRRQMTAVQRRELLITSLRLDPQLSEDEQVLRTGSAKSTIRRWRAVLANEGVDSLPAAVVAATVQAPRGAAKPQGRPRAPLGEDGERLGIQIRKLTLAVKKLYEDDRFTKNRELLGTQLRHHVTEAIQALERLDAGINTPIAKRRVADGQDDGRITED